METIAPDGAPKGAVLVIHSWWGLTTSFRTYASVLSEAGYLVGLTDLFDGKTAETEAQAKALRAARRRNPMYRTLATDIASLRAEAGSSGMQVGVVGFSMGGHWAVWLSQRPEYNISATVLYYAARAGDFSKCHSGIIAHFAEKDPWVSKGARRTMEHAINKSRCAYSAFDYPETQHWFAETARVGAFDESAARLARDRDLGHLEQNLICLR